MFVSNTLMLKEICNFQNRFSTFWFAEIEGFVEKNPLRLDVDLNFLN
jgi:hypothetical protein